MYAKKNESLERVKQVVQAGKEAQQRIALTSNKGAKPDARGAAVASGVIRTAAAVNLVTKHGVKVASRSDSKGRAQGDDQLARDSRDAAGRLRSAAFGSGTVVTRRNLSVPTLSLWHGNVQVGKVRKYFGVQPPKNAGIAKLGVPIPGSGNGYRVAAEEGGVGVSHAIAGAHSAQAEYENLDKRGRRVNAVGRLFLGALSVPPNGILKGGRLGMFAINPMAFGSRLKLLADAFENCKAKHLSVVYQSSDPSVQPGSIVLYARTDIATPTTTIGVDELSHAATHDSWVETQVWQNCRMTIAETDALKEYFDESSGDLRWSTQGLIIALASSDLSTTVVGEPLPLGNLYLEYDYEFTAEEVDYEVADLPSGQCAVIYDTFTSTQFDPVVIPMAPGGAGTQQFTNVSMPLPNTDFLLYGVVTNIVENAGGGPGLGPVLYCPDDGEQFQLSVGMGFFFRFQNAQGQALGSASVSLCMFRDLESASDSGALGGHSDGLCRYALAQPMDTTITFDLRSIDLSE